MPTEPDANATAAFLALAASQDLLPTGLIEEASRAAAAGRAVADVVLEKGMMDAVQVDIVETLLSPRAAFPGYEILSMRGRGGMGIVYEARQLALDRIVALKVVLLRLLANPVAVSRFEKEARTVAGLRHPNIVTAYDFGRHQGRLFFAMEFLEGETLEGLADKSGPLPEALAWGLARQVASGLGYAAQRGLVHRDIKPANLFVVEPPPGFALPPGMPFVKITDFGLVLKSDDLGDDRLTAAGTTVGTPLYMAPEQLTSTEIDHRVDIYALGATVYHLLRGRPAFGDRKQSNLLLEKLRLDLPPLEGFPPGSAALLAAMMARDPAARLGSYAELIERIDTLQASSSILFTRESTPPATIVRHGMSPAPTQVAAGTPATVDRPPGSTPFRSAGPRRWRMVLLGTFLLLVVGLAMGVALWWREPAATPNMVASDRAAPLFNGESVSPPNWIIRAGQWRPGADAEGGLVLTGRGVVTRRLPAWANYRVSLAADLQQAAAVELHFGFDKQSDDPSRLVLRLTPDGVQLGRRSGDQGDWQPLNAIRRAPPPADVDAPAYRELRAERHGTTWWAYFDGKTVGSAPTGPDEPAEIRLVTEGGPVHFDAMEVAELVRK